MSTSAKDTPVMDQRFQIFDGGIEDVSVESEKIIEYRPIAKIDRGQSIDIAVPRSGSYYYDLSRSYMKVEVKITKSKEVALTADDKCAFVNQPLFSIFQSWQFLLENVDFARSTGPMLGYKALLDSLLYRSTEYLESSGQSALFYKDTSGAMSATDPAASKGVNQGLVQRYNVTKAGNYVTLRAALPLDLTSLNAYLPNAMEIRVRLFPAKESFGLISADPTEIYEIHINQVSLCLLAITPSPRMLQLHSEEFKKKNAVYHYDRSVLKSYSISTGSSSFEVESLFGSSIPKELVVTFVSTSSFLGAQKENPYDLQNWKINKLSFDVESLPVKTFTPDFEGHKFIDEYNNLYSSPTGAARSGIINLNDFKSGYTIFRVYNIESMFKTKTGHSRLTVTFKDALTQGVTCLIYAKFASRFEIDATRNIL